MRKYLPYILILAVVVGVLGPVGTHFASADWFGIPTLGELINRGAAWIGYLVLKLISFILTLAGVLLDKSIEYSIVDFADHSKNIVSEGWTLSRDLANMFFIFILLYIAIATILQISGYGMKQLLVTVIILALLVNFSLLITRVIIDGSNILAMEFYNKITKITDQDGKSISMSEALVGGLNPQTIFRSNEETAKCKKFEKVDGKTTDRCLEYDQSVPVISEEGVNATLSNIVIITAMGSILFLVLAFVFFAGAILFIIRTITLWLLMILAPLAFLAMALPSLKGYASQWWKKLFDQSFFAPAYLFLLYLVIKMVSSGAFLNDIKNESFASTFLDPTKNIDIVLKFIIAISLSLAALVIAKSMGAAGAGAMQAWGNKAKNWGQGYAGKISKRGAGKASETILKHAEKNPEGRISGALKVVPGVTRGLAKASSWREQQIKARDDKYKKQYGSYSDAALSQMTKNKFGAADFVGLEPNISGPLITEAKRKEIDKILLDRTIKGAKGKVEKDFKSEGGENLKDIEKQILSLRREAQVGGARGEEAYKKMVQMIVTRKTMTERVKKEKEEKFGKEEDNTKKEIDEIKAKLAEGGGGSKSPSDDKKS